MVPLTSSLYVPGVMEENNSVMLEVGAGYFIEEDCDKAKDYCDRKMKLLADNRNKAAEVLQVKRVSLQKVSNEYQKRVELMQKQMEAQK